MSFKEEKQLQDLKEERDRLDEEHYKLLHTKINKEIDSFFKSHDLKPTSRPIREDDYETLLTASYRTITIELYTPYKTGEDLNKNDYKFIKRNDGDIKAAYIAVREQNNEERGKLASASKENPSQDEQIQNLISCNDQYQKEIDNFDLIEFYYSVTDIQTPGTGKRKKSTPQRFNSMLEALNHLIDQ